MMANRIPIQEIDLHPSYHKSSTGGLFFWNQQLYRFLTQKNSEYYKQLFEESVIQKLIDKGLLIETEITDLKLEDYPLVIKHRQIPFVSYPYEWCFDQLKDAALLVIDLETELLKHGFTLPDPHAWNILFDGIKPVYVDFCSITKDTHYRGKGWFGIGDFTSFFLYPLYLMAIGHVNIARSLLHNCENGVRNSDFFAILDPQFFKRKGKSPLIYGKPSAKIRILQKMRFNVANIIELVKSYILGNANKRSYTRLNFLEEIRKEVEQLSFPYIQSSASSADHNLPFDQNASRTALHHDVHDVLKDLQPNSILQVGCKETSFLELATNMGIKTIAIDANETYVTQLYRIARKHNLRVLPLVIDIRWPSPGFGIANREYPPASQRLKSEMILALDIFEMLVDQHSLDFHQIAKILCSFSSKYVLIEFSQIDKILPKNLYGRIEYKNRYEWYNLENLIKVFGEIFKSVSTIATYPESRNLLLCKK